MDLLFVGLIVHSFFQYMGRVEKSDAETQTEWETDTEEDEGDSDSEEDKTRLPGDIFWRKRYLRLRWGLECGYDLQDIDQSEVDMVEAKEETERYFRGQ